jgi:SH3 domain protein
LALLVLLGLGADAARAEKSWVQGEVRLNLRTGPGTEFRILAGLKTGDAVELLERTEHWTRVRHGELEGWIPEGYLQPTPPPAVQLGQLSTEVETLRQQLSALGAEAAGLRQSQAELTAREAKQASELERLRRENAAFRTGARWPEWFAGSALLAMGMLLGVLVRAVGARPRIRRVRL